MGGEQSMIIVIVTIEHLRTLMADRMMKEEVSWGCELHIWVGLNLF